MVFRSFLDRKKGMPRGSPNAATRSAQPFSKPLRILALVLVAAIFWIDAFVPADVAVSCLYGPALLLGTLSYRRPSRMVIILWALACIVLTLVGFRFYLDRGGDMTAAVNTSIGLVIIAFTALRLLRARAVDERAATSDRRYRRIFDTLAIAIWEHDFTPVVAAIEKLKAAGVTDLRSYVANHPEFVIAARRTVRITDVNATALAMMGVDTKDAFFASLGDFLPESDESFAECIIALDERWPLFQVETHVVAATGERIEILVTFSLSAEADLAQVPGSIVDIGRRKRAEAQVVRTREALARAERTSSIAALSAAIAHEVNQPLFAIQGYADAAKRWLDRPLPDIGEATAALVGLERSVGYARDVVRRIRGLVGASALDRQPIDLAQLLTDTQRLFKSGTDHIGSCLKISVTPYAHVGGDRILLKQVFVNLIVNAYQAMTELTDGEKLIEGCVLVEQDRVIVSIADRGTGFDEHTKAAAFATFFTTKPAGMGLGLPICRTIVERHDGSISIEDRPGGGTVVSVMLPRLRDQLLP